MLNLANEIKQILTMQQVAEFYGFSVSRSGFIQCPFHSGDHTASMKLYPGHGGYHCFGCGAHGSVIDFVMNLFDLNFRQAILRLNADFNLGLTSQSPDKDERSKIIDARIEEKQKKDQDEANFRFMVSEMWYWKEVIELFPPIRTGDDAYYHPLYVEAIKRLPYIEYWLDDFIEKGGEAHCKNFLSTQKMIT